MFAARPLVSCPLISSPTLSTTLNAAAASPLVDLAWSFVPLLLEALPFVVKAHHTSVPHFGPLLLQQSRQISRTLMSRSTDQLPPRGKQRPHSFDIGLQERQGHQSTAKSRGVYKCGDGTFMFASTSMATALDNLQFYPKVSSHRLVTWHQRHQSALASHVHACLFSKA